MESFERKKELEVLRSKIVEAIRYSRNYWMVFKEKTFGIATILDLIYKRSYIEVLFFTKYDVINYGAPLLKITTPIETEVDFNDILIEPDFDDDGLLNPKKIILRLNNLIRNEINHHISILEKEAQLIQEKYENYMLDDNPYKRKIIVHFKNLFFDFSVDFEKYPLIPKFIFPKSLSTIFSANKLLETEIFKKWKIEKALHVIETIDFLIEIFSKKLKLENLNKNSQHIILKNLTVNKNFKNISFKILRGQSLGIFYEMESLKNTNNEQNPLKEFFQVISGTRASFTGKIEIFGRNIQLLLKSERRKIKSIFPDNNVSFNNLTVMRDLLKNVPYNAEKNKFKANVPPQLKKNKKFLKKINKIYQTHSKKEIKKDFIEKILKLTGLYDRKHDKIKTLSKLEQLIYQISRVLLDRPSLVLFSMNSTYLGRLEIEKLSKTIEDIQKKLHIIFIIHGSKEIISTCNQIMTISQERTDIGSIDDYIHMLPQSGEVITIELSNPDRIALKEMRSLSSVVFIEERRNEKYKLFVKEDPEIIIIYLLELFGPKLYNFKRFKATLGEYIEFLESKKYGIQYKLR